MVQSVKWVTAGLAQPAYSNDEEDDDLCDCNSPEPGNASAAKFCPGAVGVIIASHLASFATSVDMEQGPYCGLASFNLQQRILVNRERLFASDAQHSGVPA